jgi:hypothetical protein
MFCSVVGSVERSTHLFRFHVVLYKNAICIHSVVIGLQRAGDNWTLSEACEWKQHKQAGKRTEHGGYPSFLFYQTSDSKLQFLWKPADCFLFIKLRVISDLNTLKRQVYIKNNSARNPLLHALGYMAPCKGYYYILQILWYLVSSNK